MDYPPPIGAYLLNRTARRLHLAYFILDSTGCIIRWGGALSYYRIQEPHRGMPISELLFFTEGMLPMDDDELVLECLELPSGTSVDAHFFYADSRRWLLLLDATNKVQSKRLLQQKANELALLHDAHARILDQYLGRGTVDRLMKIDCRKGGERRVLSVLFADIRGFTAFCEHRPPAEVFDMLNAYLTAMIRPVIDGGGVVDKIIGDAVMAIFGLLPSSLSAADLAVDTARQIQLSNNALSADRKEAGQPDFDVGVGIATGPVVMGVLGSKDRRTLSVTGHPVNLAARLESRALPGEILINQTTFDALERDRTVFVSRVLNLKGMGSPITAYGWMTHHEH